MENSLNKKPNAERSVPLRPKEMEPVTSLHTGNQINYLIFLNLVVTQQRNRSTTSKLIECWDICLVGDFWNNESVRHDLTPKESKPWPLGYPNPISAKYFELGSKV